MDTPNDSETNLPNAPEAIVRTRKQISIVWLVPIVAVFIAGWLAYKAFSEKGPIITITFDSAEGLEAGKTKIKYKDVQIGLVNAITLSRDLTNVVVTAELTKDAENYLTENTRFWVVRARVAAGEVSGLGTLFSGAYIGMDPGKAGKPARKFKGLEDPPVVTTDLPGRHFVLKSDDLGSLDIGSPVYYRKIKVGQVVSYKLEPDGQSVNIRIFVRAPHHELVRKTTKFWNAGGLDMTLDASGIRINTESLATLMLGGIAFDTRSHLIAAQPAGEDEFFTLYESREHIYEKRAEDLTHFLLQFQGSVRGLTIGAPVELKGIKIGRVLDIKAEFDLETLSHQVIILIGVDLEEFTWVGETSPNMHERGQKLVERGLRAQLKTGNLLTGQLFVDFDFFPDAAPVNILFEGKYPELPTLPAPLEMLTVRVDQLLGKIEQIPIAEIGSSLKNVVSGAERIVMSAKLQEAVAELNQTLKNTRQFTENMNTKISPEINTAIAQLNATMQQAEKTLADAGSVIKPDSQVYRELRRALQELADAAKSIRIMAEYLERHPDALIYGKGKK